MVKLLNIKNKYIGLFLNIDYVVQISSLKVYTHLFPENMINGKITIKM